MEIDIPILLICLAIIFIPSGFFCARERVRQFPEDKFWDWRDWVPLLGMIRLNIVGEMSPTYIIGLVILGAGQLLPPLLETGFTGSMLIYGGVFLAFEVCGFIFLIPYLKSVLKIKDWQGMMSKISDWLFLALVSPLGLLYYAVFIHSREDYPKQKKNATAPVTETATAPGEEEMEEEVDETPEKPEDETGGNEIEEI